MFVNVKFLIRVLTLLGKANNACDSTPPGGYTRRYNPACTCEGCAAMEEIMCMDEEEDLWNYEF